LVELANSYSSEKEDADVNKMSILNKTLEKIEKEMA